MRIYLDSSSASVAPNVTKVHRQRIAVELWSTPMWALLGIPLGNEILRAWFLDGGFIFGTGLVGWVKLSRNFLPYNKNLSVKKVIVWGEKQQICTLLEVATVVQGPAFYPSTCEQFRTLWTAKDAFQ